jgi:CheY-like chemotaxis protein/GAF domain-containing protein
VDDEVVNLTLLSSKLKREGYIVTKAQNGRQALENLRAQSFDLVLLDILMPEMDGFQVLEQMKSDEKLRHIPVIVISALEKMEDVVRGIEMGALDHLTKPLNPLLLTARINAALAAKRLRDQEASYLLQIKKAKKRTDDLLHGVIPLGVALSAEHDFNRLLEKILLEAKSFCNADAGTIYLRTKDNLLEFVMVHNSSLNIAMGGTTGREIPFAPLQLYDEATGQSNHCNVATYAALSGISVNIPDAYQVENFDFSGTKAFDAKTGYRSTSFLTIPLKNSLNQVSGVLQLINAQDPETGTVIPFDSGVQQMMESLSLLATVALDAYKREQSLRQEIQELRIELNEARQKSRVAEITETEYFRQLQNKAEDLRKIITGTNG